MRWQGLLLTLCLFGPLPAMAADIRTSINAKSDTCRFEGEGLICRGARGWRVAIGYHGLGPTLAFLRPGQRLADPLMPPADGQDISIFDIGPPDTATWHGETVIIPLKLLTKSAHQAMVDSGDRPKDPPDARVFAVYRLGREGNCAFAYVDYSDREGSRLAIEAAEAAGRATCPVEAIRLIGKPSAALASYFSR